MALGLSVVPGCSQLLNARPRPNFLRRLFALAVFKTNLRRAMTYLRRAKANLSRAKTTLRRVMYNVFV